MAVAELAPRSHAVGEPLLAVRNLKIALTSAGRSLELINDVSFSLMPGERVGVVGESGCGKTITGLTIMGLLPSHTMKLSGEVNFEGTNLLRITERAMRRVRGRRIGMIFQEPMSALDPVFTVGEQISETLRAQMGYSRKQARDRAIELLTSVGIPAPDKRYVDYPHQLSGGMRQRVMIAIALACEPALLIADEPTTALDVTVQAQIIDLLVDLSERTGTALLVITHDIGVVADACTRVITMYAGQVVEDGPITRALARPLHPYSAGLLGSLPRFSERHTRLVSIPGRVPSPDAMPEGCRFAPRCSYALPSCQAPQVLEDDHGTSVRCHRHGELLLAGLA